MTSNNINNTIEEFFQSEEDKNKQENEENYKINTILHKLNDEDVNENNLTKNNNNENSQNNNNFNSNINEIESQLIELGFNEIYSKRIIQYYHPLNLEEAIDYLSMNQGIIQHRFIQEKNLDICFLCGEKKEIHLDYNKENEDLKSIATLKEINLSLNIDNNEISKNESKTKKENSDFELEKICEVCTNNFVSNKENTLEKCGHSFCNNCWYNFLYIQIQENKLSYIKCLNYNCKEKLSEKFIINLLQDNIELINKYKRYKLELEIINSSNKKFCPFPNCDSYLELKDEKNKDVTCLNNHTFCFFCLKKPHGKISCNENLDSSMIEFAQNNFVKKCPNCGIITEKSSGCNHIICAKCNYQWCWLCNEKYESGHYNNSKCKGYQFFKPKDEYDIKLAFEGKIELNESQRQYNIENINDIDCF